MDEDLSPLFQYPPIVLDFSRDRVPVISEGRFLKLLQSQQAFSKGLCEVYWSAKCSVKLCQEILQAGIKELFEGIDDLWFFRFTMALSKITDEIFRGENELQIFIERADKFLGDYLRLVSCNNGAPKKSTSHTDTLTYCLTACMNLLYREADVKQFSKLILRVLKIMELERCWLDYYETQLFLGLLTNYLCQVVRHNCHTDIEWFLGDALGAGIAGLRHSVPASHPYKVIFVPFTRKDLSAASALLRNALAVSTPGLLSSILRPDNVILTKYRIADGAADLIRYLSELLHITPDRHAVHCLCNLVHNPEWNSGLADCFLGTNRKHAEKCFDLLNKLIKHENLPDPLKRTARVCLWGAKKLAISWDDIVYWSSALGLAPSSIGGSDGEGVGELDDVTADKPFAKMGSRQDVSKYDDVNFNLTSQRLQKMVIFVKQDSVNVPDENPQMKSKEAFLSPSLGPEEADESAFVFARDHAFLISEVDTVPVFPPQWEHHKFNPRNSICIFESNLLEDFEMKGDILVDLKVYVIGVYPRPHWPNVQPKKSEVKLEEKLDAKVDDNRTTSQLINDWIACHPFDAYLYIRDGRQILIYNHCGREIHVFMKFRKNHKKSV